MTNCGFLRPIGLATVLLVIACGPKAAIETAMSSEGSRRDSFEATLEILDEHPEYVDELYTATLRHPDTLDRFVQNVASGLTNEQLAQMTAKRLGENPESMKAMMRALVQQAQKDEKTRRALLGAIQENGEPLAGLIVNNPKVLSSLLSAFAKAGVHKGQDKLDALIDALDSSE
jgi:hypothetical protein